MDNMGETVDVLVVGLSSHSMPALCRVERIPQAATLVLAGDRAASQCSYVLCSTTGETSSKTTS
jgi:hypothetical protein